uniref:Uncharacterized protein n=1 Tax=Anguilla anguilla TaxID=7936 RepID=A0A0E9QKT7_ANGAN
MLTVVASYYRIKSRRIRGDATGFGPHKLSDSLLIDSLPRTMPLKTLLSHAVMC